MSVNKESVTHIDNREDDRLSIAFVPGGGIGDMIISLPVLDYLLDKFPDAEFHICNTVNVDIYKTLAGPKRLPRLTSIHKGFADDLRCHIQFEANEFVKILASPQFLEENESFAFTYLKNQIRIQALNGADKIFPNSGHQIGEYAVKMGLNRVTLQQWTLGFDQFTYPKIEHIEPMNPGFKYISLNDGWNGTYIKTDRSTKAYTVEGWTQLIKIFKENGIKTVQLGSGEMGEDYDADVQLRGKTKFDESLRWLKGSMCHYDCEGGLVHAATAMGVPCTVLHGPTNHEFFGYDQNINLINGGCQNCWSLTKSWAVKCMRKNQTCMNHSPQTVFDVSKHLLSGS